jgi:predicted Zn-dependent peptidase
MEYQYYTLKNGIRLVHSYNAREVAHCGITMNTGSRDETEDENGMAHFIEHVIFKGTKKRKAYHVLSRLENIGGDLNAFTTKEETCIYASFLNSYYERTLELIGDITFNSVFPEKEIQKEKDVVLDEINSYKDSPSELIFDDFEELLYDGHPIARNILGTPKSVKSFTKEKIKKFILKNYHTDQMVISSVGDIKFEKLIKLVEKHFGEVRENRRKHSRNEMIPYVPAKKSIKMRTYLSHTCIGNIAYPRNHENRLGLVLLNNLLGGPSLNSRLALAVREKHGYTYDIESHYQPYSDTGLFCVYLGTDKEHIDKSVRLVKKELNLLRRKQLGSLQLQRAKQQIIGQLAISLESNLSEMLSMGRSLLQINKIDSVREIHDAINAISAKQLQEIANEIFDPKQLSLLTYKGD